MAKKKFYVVWKGREPGIYTDWAGCKAQVDGFREAEYKAFPSRAMAEEAFNRPYEDYKGVDLRKIEDLSPAERRRIGDPIQDSFAVDAACDGSPGRLEYRGVYTATGTQFFRQGPFEDGTNNVGEFLALVHTLALAKRDRSAIPVYSDSRTALSWVKAKRCRTKLKSTAKNQRLFELITRAEKWLADNDYPNPLLKWETKAWGEIPADFGRK